LIDKAVSNDAAFIYPNREALSHPQTVLPGSRIGLNDDSQFFATALIYPNLPESFAPPIVMIGGATSF